jgi:hypothetical protein
MKNFDHMLTGHGIDVGYWHEAQTEPELVNALKDELKIKITCWLNYKEDPNSEAIDAPYELIITFKDVLGYQKLHSELPHYTLDYGNYDDPPFIFRIDHHSINVKKLLHREPDSWYPRVFERNRDTTWFEQLEKWKPDELIDNLPQGIEHFLVRGHDTFIEILSKSFSIEKVQKM